MAGLPIVQRVAAYAVVLRDDRILLSRLAERLTEDELWTLPGGGLDHGEDPRDAVVRELQEETGLDVEIGDTARVYSFHAPSAWRDGRRVDVHSLRIVYDGWVPVDAPEPRVMEVDGSTAEAAWVPLADVLDGTVPVVSLVREALAEHRPYRRQRVAANALITRAAGTADGASAGEELLLTRISDRGFHSGSWTLPGGGVDHAESPARALVREVHEETGLACRVVGVLDVHDVAFAGTAPSGRHEDFHSINLIFEASVEGADEPRVVELDGTTDAVAWVPRADVESGAVPVLDLVHHALAAADRRRASAT